MTAADIELSFVGELESARVGIAADPHISRPVRLIGRIGARRGLQFCVSALSVRR
jgi:hypothetical protein